MYFKENLVDVKGTAFCASDYWKTPNPATRDTS